jgi:cellulose biosynthesis protein BcsQ
LRSEFAVIIIDTPPGRSFFGQRALASADLILVPCEASEISVKAMANFLQHLSQERLIKDRRNRPPQNVVRVWTKYKDNDQVHALMQRMSDETRQTIERKSSTFDDGTVGSLIGLPASPHLTQNIARTDARSFESVYADRPRRSAKSLADALLERLKIEPPS